MKIRNIIKEYIRNGSKAEGDHLDLLFEILEIKKSHPDSSPDCYYILGKLHENGLI